MSKTRLGGPFGRLLAGAFAVTSAFLLVPSSFSQIPQLINYQGRVVVSGANFSGSGQFRFALVNAAGNTTYWSNDGTSAGGSQPASAVPITVASGLYSVLLGDTALSNMTTIPPSVFNNSDVRLRVWFDDGTHGAQLLTPDQRIAAVGYAVMAGNVPDGAITGAKIAAGTITGSNIAAGTITGANIAGGAIGNTQLAAGSAAANLAAGSQSAVGSGGIIFSAAIDPALVSAGYVNIGTMTTTDGWQQRVTTAPPANGRFQVTGVWTGSEMIVWGGWTLAGQVYFNDGSRYNPVSNSWTALPAAGAPSARRGHTAVWTGTEMIVWGGSNAAPALGDGSRYNPVTNA
jgi:Galactose oxidase, central domain